MSLDEQIAELELEKMSCLRQYDERIASLKHLRSSTWEQEAFVPRTGRFRPIPSSGEPASEIIIRERGGR